MKTLTVVLTALATISVFRSPALAAVPEPMCARDAGSCLATPASSDPTRLGCWHHLPGRFTSQGCRADVREQAEKWGRTFEVEASWITSHAVAESRCRPEAVSSAGATGVMQVKLARARDLVRWIRRSTYAAEGDVELVLASAWRGLRTDLHRVDLNVMLAAYDLRRLTDKFGKNRDLVAAAYNQGEGKIARCLAAGRPLPPRAAEYVKRVRRTEKHT